MSDKAIMRGMFFTAFGMFLGVVWIAGGFLFSLVQTEAVLAGGLNKFFTIFLTPFVLFFVAFSTFLFVAVFRNVRKEGKV